ncbi:MAG: diaminopimelate decarboxylase [Acidimicrobiaceae bacterium]|nr:diaminopimelate decarboxylase [Acidimicrobiaceae bacterium]
MTTREVHDETRRLLDLFAPGSAIEGEELVIGGCRVRELAETFATPALIIDERALRQRARRYRDGLSARWANSQVVWASKSLPCTAIYRIMGEEGLGVDVAGGGELVMALSAGVDPGRIVLHGNAKTDDELQRAVRAEVGTIVIDNFDDIDRLEKLVTNEQAVLVRVVPNVDAPTHDAIATGHANSKFGLSFDDAERAIARLRASQRLRLDGLHVHVGSQILSTEPFTRAIEAIARLGKFPVYDLGGGLGARYTHEMTVPSVEQYLDALVASAREHLPAESRILIEPGRSMVAESAMTLYSVVTVKRGAHRSFVAVDGGMGDNLEVSLYDQAFDATVANRVGRGENFTLVGRHCESGDQLIESVALRDPRIGDLIAVPVTGAYCMTMANNYNGALRPPIVMVRDATATLVQRRETYDDLLRRDVTP